VEQSNVGGCVIGLVGYDVVGTFVGRLVGLTLGDLVVGSSIGLGVAIQSTTHGCDWQHASALA